MLQCLYRECPFELKEATSSLIFASSRCGEFPELHKIKEILTSKFGKEFADHAVELHKNNRVNSKVKIRSCDTSLQENKSSHYYSDDFSLAYLDDTEAFTKTPRHGNQNESSGANCYRNWSYLALGEGPYIDKYGKKTKSQKEINKKH